MPLLDLYGAVIDYESPEKTIRCPICSAFPDEGGVSQRAAVETEVGLIGAGPEAGLDYLAAIANALVDIRNKFFAE